MASDTIQIVSELSQVIEHPAYVRALLPPHTHTLEPDLALLACICWCKSEDLEEIQGLSMLEETLTERKVTLTLSLVFTPGLVT